MPDNQGVVILGDGSTEVRSLPWPELGPRQALVRVSATAVSTGTETTLIRNRLAKPAPDAEPWPIGYSAAGVVEQAGDAYDGPPPGTPVACYGGPYVGHRAVCAVAPTLIAPSRVGPEEAAFGGIGAIAMHAVREAKVSLGERVGVMGLGVLGQIVAQLARAAGAWVLASDPIPSRRALALSLGTDAATTPDEFPAAVEAFTEGAGLDAVLVVAGSPDSAVPAVQAANALRFRGRLMVVGNVRTEWPREKLFQKEASVQVSRAAGPGRYDASYERDAQDWPAWLAPWTEGRNLRCFVDLLAAGRIQVAPLISDIMPLDQAPRAIKRLMDEPEDTMALVLRFPEP